MRFLLLLVNALLVSVAAFEPKRHAKSQEIQLPTRDGTYLHTMIYFPHDYEASYDYRHGGMKVPVIMDRSPYGYNDMEWLTDIFLPFGFVAIGQDMRGTEKSEGNFTLWQADAKDSTDLGEWILHQPWSNGEIHTIGFSADGIGSIQTLKPGNNWLKSQYIGWASSELYTTLYPYGTYKEKTVVDWLTDLNRPDPAALQDNLELATQHETQDDFWQSIELSDEDFAKVNHKSGHYSGWYDLFLIGNLKMFEGYNSKSNPSVRGSAVITIDPCGHCLEAGKFFTQNAVDGRTALVLGQLFETMGVRNMSEHRSEIKNITFYVMSSNDKAGHEAGLYWTSLEDWPSFTSTPFYFHSDKTMSQTQPAATETASSSYTVDPADPVPTIGGNNLPDSIGGSIPCGPMDQQSLNSRTDILSFTTEAMTDELAMTGPLMANLWVSTDAVDTDIMVKISDVYPDGVVRILQDNAMRLRWRNGGPNPEYATKGDVYNIEISIWNTSYVVAPGHKLRVSIASSNFPRFSVNPQNGLLLADPAYPGENVTATNTLYHSADYPSSVSLPIVKKSQLPEVDVYEHTRRRFPRLTDEMIKKTAEYLEKVAKRQKN